MTWGLPWWNGDRIALFAEAAPTLTHLSSPMIPIYRPGIYDDCPLSMMLSVLHVDFVHNAFGCYALKAVKGCDTRTLRAGWTFSDFT